MRKSRNLRRKSRLNPSAFMAPAIIGLALYLGFPSAAAYADLAAFLAAGGKASDSSGSALTFSLVSDSGLVGSCPGTVTRVYRVADACANSAQATQTITVDDTIAPTLVSPVSVTVECDALQALGRATATDNCSTNVNVTYSDTPVQSEYDIKFYVADPDLNARQRSAHAGREVVLDAVCARDRARFREPVPLQDGEPEPGEHARDLGRQRRAPAGRRAHAASEPREDLLRHQRVQYRP